MLENTVRMAELLHELGAQVLIPEDVRGGPLPDYVARLPVKASWRSLDLVISLGGDGTLLRCAQYAGAYGVPLLGVNLGNVGMLTELETDEYEKIAHYFSGDFEIDRRMMLSALIINGASRTLRYALNDIVVFRGSVGQSIRLRVSVDGQHLYDLYGDGIIIATPTGSSGYSLSAGGPLVEPNAGNILLTPVCPYASRAHSFVLDAERKIEIVPSCAEERHAFVTVDGRRSVKLKGPSSLVACKASRYVDIVRVKRRGFYQIVHEKLEGSEQ